MITREDALHTVEQAYAARARGDKASLAQYWAKDAVFRIAGDDSLHQNVALRSDNPMNTLEGLIDQFEFSDLRQVDAVVEANKVAVRWEVSVSCGGKPPVRTELMDLITLDDEGKIASFVQFADTAQIRELMTS